MPQRYDTRGLGASFGRMGDMISNHVMRMPAVRHQLAVEAGNAARQNAVAEAQVQNYQASSRKGNASAALDEDELSAAKELQAVMSRPGAIVQNPNGSVTISPEATGSLLAPLARAGTRGRNFGLGSKDLLSARNAPAEAESNRVATGERNKYSVDERESTRREAPIVLHDDARLVTPAGEQLGGLGLHKLNPDQTLIGDVPGVELKRLGTGLPKPPQQARTREEDAIELRRLAGSLTDIDKAMRAETRGTPAYLELQRQRNGVQKQYDGMRNPVPTSAAAAMAKTGLPVPAPAAFTEEADNYAGPEEPDLQPGMTSRPAVATAPTAPAAAPNYAQSLLDEANKAISLGADPMKVRERLRAKGIQVQ